MLLIRLKFIYSEKATKFCKILTLLLSVCTVDKSKVKISQNFVAFSEYMNFNLFQMQLILQLNRIILNQINGENRQIFEIQ